MTKVLVAYASKYHATAEIAEEIGKILHDSGRLQVQVQDVRAVIDVSEYDAVVIGSAVYSGQWQPEAADFLKQHQKALAQRLVWLFSSGPTGEGSPIALTRGWDFPEALRPLARRIGVRETALFHGSLRQETLSDAENFNWGERMVLKAVHPPVGDYRDWSMIHNWANHIAETLKVLLPQVGD